MASSAIEPASGGMPAIDSTTFVASGGTGGTIDTPAATPTAPSATADPGYGGTTYTTTGANGGAAPTPLSCTEEFACPEFGSCWMRAEDWRCVRVCEFDVEITTIEDLEPLTTLGCEVLVGELALRDTTFAGEVQIDGLLEIEGSLVIARAPNLTRVALPDLVAVRGGVRMLQLDGIKSIELPGLVEQTATPDIVSHGIEVSVNPLLDHLDLGSLKSAVQLQILSNGLLAALRMDALESVEFLIISGHPELATLGGLPALRHLGQWYVTGNPKLPQCELDEIASHVDAACGLCQENDDTATCG
jgi:hypothetical protein